ncbi:MAG: hypothetical protein DRO89_03725 [Candidatus Altiarchaeales archaeon]|nr:MAG: hypothetical protein DRO89_03725 [Candidatus Altiarchaeales archaeon]
MVNVKKLLRDIVEKYPSSAVVMMELPTESYFDVNIATVKFLIDREFEGIYISFHRPFKNILSLFEQHKIDTNKLFFIDTATALSKGTGEENPRCIYISKSVDIDELIRAIYITLPKLKGRGRFIFIDSITTIAIYKPLSETMRFSEFLIRIVRKNEVENVIFNVARDLVQKKFIRDIALRVDKVISVAE